MAKDQHRQEIISALRGLVPNRQDPLVAPVEAFCNGTRELKGLERLVLAYDPEATHNASFPLNGTGGKGVLYIVAVMKHEIPKSQAELSDHIAVARRQVEVWEKYRDVAPPIDFVVVGRDRLHGARIRTLVTSALSPGAQIANVH
jgi:hypothetical protein